MKNLNVDLKSKELEKIMQRIDAKSASIADLYQVLNNSKYEFDIELSSRMLNYYEQLGFIHAHRVGKGKRRFSFLDILRYKIALLSKSNIAQNVLVQQLISKLDEAEAEDFSALALIGLISTVLIGQHEVYLMLGGGNHIQIGNSVKPQLSLKKRPNSVCISQLIREIIFIDDDNLRLTGKAISFLPDFIYGINKVRKKLGIPFVAPDSQDTINNMGNVEVGRVFEFGDVKDLAKLPIHEATKKFDIVYEDGEYVYGIEIKCLGKVSDQDFLKGSIVSTQAELLKAVDAEIKATHRFQEKLNRTKYK